MAEVLLISEDTVKEITNVDDNLACKYMKTAIREAQDFKLLRILGEPLTEKLKLLVNNNQINDKVNSKYKILIRKCKYVLAYATIVQLCDIVPLKIANFGVVKTTDDKLEMANQEEMLRIQTKYQSKCDAYVYQLQNFLLENKKDYPELTEFACRKIKSNLRATASCGIFLGGARGKRLGGC